MKSTSPLGQSASRFLSTRTTSRRLRTSNRGSSQTSDGVSTDLRRAYRLLRAHYGHLHWWPGETPFEVCVGAILTQNTSWTNVEKAIRNLKSAGALDPHRLAQLPGPELERLLQPAGYFRIKARRLRAFVDELVRQADGDLHALFRGDTATVRARLLAIHGIGPETADSMLLYAGGHANFVVDAYTRRIFLRHGWCQPAACGYEDLQRLCATALQPKDLLARLDYWQDYHAQLVMVGKDFCRKQRPNCPDCPLRPLLPGPQLHG